MPGLVVLGGRNLGGAILDRFLADGWAAAGVSITEATAQETRARGALAEDPIDRGHGVAVEDGHRVRHRP